ncbi:hypothetical protein ACFOYW_03555 [Gryllotalpicola reticulitermitis]|uniref:Prepilin-type N-terminal cleavage/methylation domain-containing protein n=1 Tax=Gryllotalpicola reticulitermitis TaxID=1184153 RepID=A0ABV8Q534_9MICO
MAQVGGDERGIGLIEIVISMFLLAIITVALVPLLVNGYKVSAQNRLVARASQLVSWNIEDAQHYNGGIPSCASIASLVSVPQAPASAPSGVQLQLHFAGACGTSNVLASGGYLVPITVSVTQAGTTQTLASASTSVYVTG